MPRNEDLEVAAVGATPPSSICDPGNLFLNVLVLIFPLMAGCPAAVAYEYRT
jgi:hypothetical protein